MRQLLMGVLLVSATGQAVAAAPRVNLEILTQPGLAPTAAHQWYEALTKLGITNLQIRSGNPGEEMGIETTGTGSSKSFRVTGILGTDNTLQVPGGKFGMRDYGRIQTWLNNLGTDGVEGVTAPRAAFGMTPSQIEHIHADLRRPVSVSTVGMTADQAVSAIAKSLRGPVRLAPGAGGELARVTLEDELRGITSGTALAAIARPAGLVFAPARQANGKIEYRIGPPVKGEQTWSIGFTPQQRAVQVLPAMFDVLNVEISEIPVSEALQAIQERLKVPFIYDRNAMALHGADPTAAPAEVPGKRLSYSQVVGKVLSQAGMRYELRVDESDRPFLWITTIKPAP